jgi:ActR/RegA family two-component response regulator
MASGDPPRRKAASLLKSLGIHRRSLQRKLSKRPVLR